jgi:hypothetical protein
MILRRGGEEYTVLMYDEAPMHVAREKSTRKRIDNILGVEVVRANSMSHVFMAILGISRISGLPDASDVRYFRSPCLSYASEFLDPAVSPASFSLLVLWPFVLCGWFWAYLGRFWSFAGSWIF